MLAAALAEPLHAADLADLLERLAAAERAELVRALGAGFDADTLAYLDEFVRDQVIEALGPQTAGEALAQLETDDAVEILAEFDEAEQKAILRRTELWSILVFGIRQRLAPRSLESVRRRGSGRPR